MKMSRQLIWKGVRRILRTFGRDIVDYRPNHHYVPDYYGRSAHKLVDIRQIPVFCDLADTTIKSGKSLLYYNRLYPIYQSLLNVTRLAGTNGSMNFAEVGVYRGGTSRFIALAIQSLNMPNGMLHSFDTFEGHASQDIRKDVDNIKIHYAGNFGETEFETVKKHLEELGNVRLYKGRFQDSCAQIADKQFHFIHLDVDIYEPTRFALDFFDSRLATGGIIMVDDYETASCPGVKRAVDEFVHDSAHYVATYLLNGQCLLVKYQRD